MAAVAQVSGVTSVGIGIPGLYDPANGSTVFLVNVAATGTARRLALPVAAAVALPTLPHQRRSRLRAGRASTGRGRGLIAWSG